MSAVTYLFHLKCNLSQAAVAEAKDMHPKVRNEDNFIAIPSYWDSDTQFAIPALLLRNVLIQ
jgi:hypothetical protein